MKKLAFLLMVLAATFIACEPENEPNPAVQGVSKVVEVSYPTIVIVGAPIVHIPVGGTFVDSGATLIDDVTGAVSHITATSSELDNTQPGLYEVLYQAKNANGFLGSASRVVLVLDYTPPAGLDPNIDLSGTYHRTSNGVEVHITKFDNGLYVTDNVGGSTPNPAYFVMPDNLSIDLPLQTSIHGLVLEGAQEQYIPGPPITLKWQVVSASYGPAIRTFVHN